MVESHFRTHFLKMLFVFHSVYFDHIHFPLPRHFLFQDVALMENTKSTWEHLAISWYLVVWTQSYSCFLGYSVHSLLSEAVMDIPHGSLPNP